MPVMLVNDDFVLGLANASYDARSKVDQYEPFFEALGREFEQRSGLRHLEDLRIRGVASTRIGPLVAAAAVARNRAD